MSTSFFEEFAKLLKPNCQRPKTDGDYYASPLGALGLDGELAYRIDPAWIHLSEDKNNHATHLCLGDLADEKISALGPGVKNHSLKICRDRIAYIYLAEVLLSIFPNPESAELKGRFFEEADTYFNKKNKAKGEKKVAPDGHKINEKTYELLMRACLATIWAEYRKRGLSLPEAEAESHCVNSDYFKVYKKQIIQRPPEDKTHNQPSLKEMEKCSVTHLAMRQLDNNLEKKDNNMIVEIDIKNDALEYYFSLYKGLGEKLAAALERNFWCYVQDEKLTYILRKNRNVNSQSDSLDGTFYVAFLVEPWKSLFRKHKEYKINYGKNDPGNTGNTENTASFSFHPQHTRSVFYETLLLVDLHEHLKKQSESYIDPLTGKPLLSGAEAPESAKLKTARKLAQQLDKAMKNNSKNSRFVRDPATMSPKQNTVMPSPLYVLDRYTEVSINVPQNDYEPCTIELQVPEEELYKSAGEVMVLSFHVFYRHQDRYEDIACDLVGEELGTDADPKTTFTLEVAQWRCADAGLDPDKTGCMAAFSGVQGAGEVVVVFAN